MWNFTNIYICSSHPVLNTQHLIMEDYRQKTLEELIELLSEKTKEFSEILLANGEDIFSGVSVEKYNKIKEEVTALKNEIQLRNTQKASKS